MGVSYSVITAILLRRAGGMLNSSAAFRDGLALGFCLDRSNVRALPAQVIHAPAASMACKCSSKISRESSSRPASRGREQYAMDKGMGEVIIVNNSPTISIALGG